MTIQARLANACFFEDIHRMNEISKMDGFQEVLQSKYFFDDMLRRGISFTSIHHLHKLGLSVRLLDDVRHRVYHIFIERTRLLFMSAPILELKDFVTYFRDLIQ